MIENARQVEVSTLSRVHLLLAQKIGAADQVFKLANTQACHDFTNFFGNEEENSQRASVHRGSVF